MSYRIEVSQGRGVWETIPTRHDFTLLATACRVIEKIKVLYPNASWRLVEVVAMEKVEPRMSEALLGQSRPRVFAEAVE